MINIDFIYDRATFMSLWQRARACVEKVAATPASALLHFDSSNIGTQVFKTLIRDIANFKGKGEFAMIVLNPDPFSYFHFHFGKYPGFIVKAHHSNDDSIDILMMDPEIVQPTRLASIQNSMLCCRYEANGLCMPIGDGMEALVS
ncbi:hypothetical protein [Paraburkholderia sp. GAS348]|uniref:hypothetical protein n=1 Tax=Paraburkholderia sp. GAS348 TaxID=3035132 RepID=UPI003D23DF57